MRISETALKHWMDSFFGYGSWDARYWFIAYEEGGGDLPEEVAEKFDYFLRAHPTAGPALCNIRQLYQHVSYRSEGPKAGRFSNLYEYRFGSSAVPNTVWQNLIAFKYGYNQEAIPDLLDQQKSSFALPAAHQEALIRLYPLPSPHNHAWYYSWLDLPQFPFLKSRLSYQEHVYQARIEVILSRLKTYRPSVVLMYGMNNINILKRSVQAQFPAAKFRMIKAVKHETPQYHHASLDGTTLLITTQIPALRHNRVETGFDWHAFGKTVRSGNISR